MFAISKGSFIRGAAIACCLGCSTAWAGFGVSPLKQEVTVDPGRKATFHISVFNTARPGATAKTVHLRVMDFVVSPEGGLSFQKPGTAEYSASKWITLSQQSVTLQPGDGKQIGCTLAAPYSARGEYYSAIMVGSRAVDKTERGISVRHRIASGVFVAVRGRTYPKLAEITECTVALPQPDSSEKSGAGLTIAATIRNKGHVRFEAEGEARIYEYGGRQVATMSLQTKRKRVLPGDVRIYGGCLVEPLPAGRYEARIVFDYGSKWASARKRVLFTIAAEVAESWAARGPKEKKDAALAGSLSKITLEPQAIKQKVPPGGFRIFHVKLANPAPRPLQVAGMLKCPEGKDALVKWTTIRPSSFLLGPRGRKTVALVIRVPAEASGGQAGEVVFSVTDPEAGKNETHELKLPLQIQITRGTQR